MCEQDADCIISTSKCSCAEWNPSYMEPKDALSAEKSSENNMLPIVLIIATFPGSYTLGIREGKKGKLCNVVFLY